MFRKAIESKGLEQKYLSDRFHSAENTMNSTISNSIGSALLALKKTYKITPEKIEECLAAIEKTPVANKKAVSAILREAREGYKSFDAVTLHVFDDESKKYLDKEEKFHIKEVLTLVWEALNDDEKFMHHYAGNVEEKLLAAKNDRANRLNSFFNCLHEVQHVCHQGKRNALVRLLNKTYAGIEFIEDEVGTIFDFTRESIDKLLFEKLESKEISEEVKTHLTSHLIHWMETGDASELLALLDPENSILKSLEDLFRKHGSNPHKVKDNFESISQCISFSYDMRKRGPVLGWVNTILNEELKGEETVKTSLQIMQKWIHDQWDIENKEHSQKLAQFYCFHRAHKTLTHYNILLKETLEEKDYGKYQALKNAADDYFEALSKNNIALPKADFSILNELMIDLEKIKIATCADKIENFFCHWFEGIREAEDERLLELSELLLDVEFQKKIILNDKTIEKIKSEMEEGAGSVRYLNTYQINRFILHAIIIPPQQWSHVFAEMAKAIYTLISDREAKGTEEDIVKRYSYTPALVTQLQFLIDTYDEKKPDVPRNMIIHPQCIWTAEQWEDFFRFAQRIASKSSAAIYQDFSKILEPIAVELLANKDSKVSTQQFVDILEPMAPGRCLQNFETLSREIKQAILYNADRFFAVFNIYHHAMIFAKESIDWNHARHILKMEPDKLLELRLHSNEKEAFINLMGANFFKELLNEKNEKRVSFMNLINLIRDHSFYEEDLTLHFLKFLGREFVKEQIEKDLYLLHDLLRLLSYKDNLELINFLGLDLIKKYLNENLLKYFIKDYLNYDSTIQFLRDIGYKHLSIIIADVYTLLDVMNFIPCSEKAEFLKLFETEKLRKMIRNEYSFKRLFFLFESKDRLSFIFKMIENSDDFYYLIKNNFTKILAGLSLSDQNKFLEYIKENRLINGRYVSAEPSLLETTRDERVTLLKLFKNDFKDEEWCNLQKQYPELEVKPITFSVENPRSRHKFFKFINPTSSRDPEYNGPKP